MRPDEYEQIVAEYFKRKGYEVKVSPYSGDYGVDVFAQKGKEKIAVQAKMFGNTSRKVNRQMVMELHGAKDYFDCSKAVIATNGNIIGNALEVANKLKIEIHNIRALSSESLESKVISNKKSFEAIWEDEVKPLQGKSLRRADGSSNKIIKVDWSGIERITSKGNVQKIKIEIFKLTINHLLRHGLISRETINNEYSGRASSGVILILANTKVFEATQSPIGLRMKNQSIV